MVLVPYYRIECEGYDWYRWRKQVSLPGSGQNSFVATDQIAYNWANIVPQQREKEYRYNVQFRVIRSALGADGNAALLCRSGGSHLAPRTLAQPEEDANDVVLTTATEPLSTV